MALNMVFYSANSIESIKTGIAIGLVSYPAYCFIRSADDETVGQLAFIDKGNVVKMIKGDTKQQVVYVDELPDVSEGDSDVLYVVGTICYKFDGEKFVSLGVDHTADIKDLDSRITTLEESTGEMADKIKTLEETVGSFVVFIELE